MMNLLRDMGVSRHTGSIDINDFTQRPDGTLMRSKNTAGTSDFGSSLNEFAENILEDLRDKIHENHKIEKLLNRVSKSSSQSSQATTSGRSSK